ncbi:hypothetical protein BRC82_00625 [Halobacteriales archaeon QS_1_67_19]|nr:MAG: hypothetical protein BRC82_00625 [Halobacteriales archaeon QS_1_67_19]
MALDGLHHLVLRVPDLADAEAFYRELFDLEVLFREGETETGEYGALPDDLDWAGATGRGVEPGMSFLGRDDFALALMEADGYANADRLDHVGLALDADDRDAVRDRATDLGCEYEEKGDALFVTDRYGVEWELNASSPPPETPFETLDV